MAHTVQNRKIRRSPNVVDRLLQEVSEIQSACEHEFQPVEKCSRNHLPLHVDPTAPGENTASREFKVQCLKCSYQEDIRYIDRCACCLGDMHETEWTAGEKYFNVTTRYRAAAVYTCEGCGFSVVTMAWDQ